VQSLVLGRTDVFVANSSQIVTDLHELGVEDGRIANFPNGVVLPPEEEVMAALDARSGHRFIFTGRLLPDKRIQVVHDAAASLLREQEELKMLFLGEGSEGSRLAALPEAGALAGRIAFPGFVKDVYPSLMMADFFVSASMREGQSNSLLEAMSAGVIPIVFDASGVRDVVDHGRTGFVVERSDAESFATIMRAAIHMPTGKRREMALAARGFAEQSIGIDAIAARTLQAVGRAAHSRRARA
jgi:glycosyltransferase involved in cell wall biosynthesis